MEIDCIEVVIDTPLLSIGRRIDRQIDGWMDGWMDGQIKRISKWITR